MKNLLTILLAVCAVTLSSCKKDNENTLNSLENTTWKGSYLPLGDPDEVAYNTYVFSKSTFSSVSIYGEEKAEGTGTYTYSAPNVTMNIGDVIIKGVVNGNKMVLIYEDGTEWITLIKQ